MRVAAVLFVFITLTTTQAGRLPGQIQPVIPDPVSGDTNLSVHNVRPAHEITLGAGAKVGILDHDFDLGAHPGLYAGGKLFRDEQEATGSGAGTHRGYWMALSLREVAPKAEIFALDIPPGHEPSRVEAMVRALAWAAKQGLDAVTYCGNPFSEADREILDPAVERAIKAGVVVVFVDYAHPENLLPGSFGPPAQEGSREPDLNIFSKDCTAVIADRLVTLAESDDDGIQRRRPYLAGPSAGPVTAGLVALLRSVDPDASPGEIKKVLIGTSRSMEYGGQIATRVPDAFEALKRVVGVVPEA